MVTRIPDGATVSRTVQLPSWPSKVRFSALGDDGWDMESIIMESANRSVLILAKGEGNTSYAPGSLHWLRHDDAAPTILTFDVPDLPATVCVTREDPRVQAMMYVTS